MKSLFLFFSGALMLISCTSSKKATTNDASLTGTHWKLTELMGKPISEGSTAKEAFLRLADAEKHASGNAGCNNFNGSFTMDEPNRIRFSQMASTQMACPDMAVESEFLSMLGTVDSYHLNGDTLQLFRARMAPLARFVAKKSSE